MKEAIDYCQGLEAFATWADVSPQTALRWAGKGKSWRGGAKLRFAELYDSMKSGEAPPANTHKNPESQSTDATFEGQRRRSASRQGKPYTPKITKAKKAKSNGTGGGSFTWPKVIALAAEAGGSRKLLMGMAERWVDELIADRDG